MHIGLNNYRWRETTSVLCIRWTLRCWLSCLSNPCLTLQVILIVSVIWSSSCAIATSESDRDRGDAAALKIPFVTSTHMIAGYHLAVCTFSKRSKNVCTLLDLFHSLFSVVAAAVVVISLVGVIAWRRCCLIFSCYIRSMRMPVIHKHSEGERERKRRTKDEGDVEEEDDGTVQWREYKTLFCCLGSANGCVFAVSLFFFSRCSSSRVTKDKCLLCSTKSS